MDIFNLEKTLTGELAKLGNLLPDELKDQFMEESYVAGGSIYSLYNDEVPHDIDVFIRTEEFKNKLLKYFDNLEGLGCKFKTTGTVRYGKYKNLKLVITKNAITIGNYQIVLKDVGEPEDVVGAFDFLHNCCWVDKGKLNGLYGYSYLSSKHLQFNKNRARDIVSTIIRTTKFMERGFKLDSVELSKMLLQLYKTGFTEDEIKLLVNEPDFTSFGSGN